MYAETILEQLGGRQFLLLTGSKNLVKDDIRKSLTMRLTSNKVKAQYFIVTLCENDTYSIEFVSVNRNFDKIVKASYQGVYNDMLQSIFTEVTGLYTKL
jgi:hypothetical protein